MIRQPNDWSCFAACVAEITGTDVDEWPTCRKATLSIYPKGLGFMTLEPPRENEDGHWTIETWKMALGIKGYGVRLSISPPPGAAILPVVSYTKRGTSAHCIIVDADGTIRDPRGDLDGLTLDNLLSSGTVEPAEFVEIIRND
jgi:hypothetical protein